MSDTWIYDLNNLYYEKFYDYYLFYNFSFTITFMIAGENDGFNFYYDPLFSLFFECRFHMSFININFGCDFGIDNYFGLGFLLT